MQAAGVAPNVPDFLLQLRHAPRKRQAEDAWTGRAHARLFARAYDSLCARHVLAAVQTYMYVVDAACEKNALAAPPAIALPSPAAATVS